jgi:alpha-beta hydrolase superfamily lysophospholipase
MTTVMSTAEPLVPAEGAARMPDGTTLRTLHWAATGEPWAVALIVHGLGEHAGRYETVAAALTGAGIDVFGYDHRGFGGSSGFRAYVDTWSQFHDDLANRVEATRAERPGLPLVMYAHSMGGLIAAGYVVAGQERPLPDLLVLSAPAIDAAQPAWKRRLAATLKVVVPRMRLSNGLPKDGLSTDPTVQQKVDADPLCVGTSTVHLAAEAFKEQDRLQVLLPGLGAMPMPTYVLHGEADPIVPVKTTDILDGKANVTRRVWPGLRHECHHEPQHEQVLAEVVAWIRTQVPGAPAAA